MHIPSPGMLRNPGSPFNQTLDQPINAPLHFLAPDIELPDHMQEIIGQNPHLQRGLVGLETLGNGLVPAESIFALLDPVSQIAPPL